MINAVLFDLDGVVRHFDPDHVADIEARHAVSPGLIQSSAFSATLLSQVTTGQISRWHWIRIVGRRIGNLPAAQEWGCQIPRIDVELLTLVDRLRARGYVVAVLTNGTDTTPKELRVQQLDMRFDAIFNSAAIGFIKPDVRAFTHVLEALSLGGGDIFFTDDSRTNVAGAKELGMPSHLYRGVRELRQALHAAGVKAL